MSENEKDANWIRAKINSLIYKLAEAKGKDIEHIQYQLRELHNQLEEKMK